MWIPATVSVVTPPAGQPVTVEELKQQIRDPNTVETAVLNLAIAAATSACENYCASGFVTRTVRLFGQGPLPRGVLEIGYGPIISVAEVAVYPDASSGTEIVSTGEYSLVGDSGLVVSEYYQGRDVMGLSILCDVGYPTVPDGLKQAILALAAHMWSRREGQGPEVDYSATVGVGTLPSMVKTVLQPYRFQSGFHVRQDPDRNGWWGY
jgi:uncharacterized phiE125 gp8 family phage protein